MSRSAGTSPDGQVTLVPAEEVEATDDVRYVDQLAPRARRAVVTADADGATAVHAPSLAAVDVVVFTDYYRVE